MKATLLALGLSTLLAAGCDGVLGSGFGIGLTVAKDCLPDPASLRIDVHVQPSGATQSSTVSDAAAFFAGSHRVVVIPPDGATSVEIVVSALDAQGATIGSGSVTVPVSGHRLFETTLDVVGLACADAGMPDLAAPPDLTRPLQDGPLDGPVAEPADLLSEDGADLTTPACTTDTECKLADGGIATSACCNGLCVDTATDDKNCLVCGMACMNATSCCAARCVDEKTDTMNCGGCGSVCKLANVAMNTCKNGGCMVGMCSAGFADCDTLPANGCEIDTNTDPKNCGGCKQACMLQNATPACTGGSCTIAMCNAGFADCDKMPGNGCEINTNTDTGNCGGCGKQCMLPNATAGCSGGSCTIAMCDPGFADCNKMPGDGCEISTATDTKNCGGCGAVCKLPNATNNCVNGSCGIAKCTQPFADCDMKVANGCEINTNNNPMNCGGCGMQCMVPNAMPGCDKGKCTIASCLPGFADCDMNPMNGCEQQTSTDPKNCGGCGISCPSKQCVNGSCAKLIFVSSLSYSSNFGGLMGADNLCQMLANNAGLGGTYKAWLSTHNSSAASRLTHSPAPYVLVIGAPVANNWNGLVSGNLLRSISVSETGNPPFNNGSCNGSPGVWTDTDSAGQFIGGSGDCATWTNANAGGNPPVLGLPSASNGTWTNGCQAPGCAVLAAVYCLEQ